MKRLACGVDQVEIKRIRLLVSTSSAEFLESIFSNEEIQYSGATKSRYGRLAARFAAKEACLKLFPQETASGSIGLRDFSVENCPYGSPRIVLSTIARAVADKYGFEFIDVSLSHTKTHAIALAIAF